MQIIVSSFNWNSSAKLLLHWHWMQQSCYSNSLLRTSHASRTHPRNSHWNRNSGRIPLSVQYTEKRAGKFPSVPSSATARCRPPHIPEELTLFRRAASSGQQQATTSLSCFGTGCAAALYSRQAYKPEHRRAPSRRWRRRSEFSVQKQPRGKQDSSRRKLHTIMLRILQLAAAAHSRGGFTWKCSTPRAPWPRSVRVERWHTLSIRWLLTICSSDPHSLDTNPARTLRACLNIIWRANAKASKYAEQRPCHFDNTLNYI